MPMSMRARILAVFRDECPDVVPYMLDLSHWFYHKNHIPWDLSVSYEKPESELIAFHKQVGAGFYMPNLGSFYSATYGSDVESEVRKDYHDGVPEIVWRLSTPLGSIERRRMWEEGSYSWAITRWGVQTEQDLRVLGYALSSLTYAPLWDRYRAWVDEVGDLGVVYLSAGYSAMGQLLNYWLGVTGTAYAIADWPSAFREVVDRINDNNLKMIDMLAASPAEIIIMGDNFSSDLQPPRFFEKWSKPYYAEAIRRLHAAGKYVAVHIDGKLRGAIGMIRAAGADCGDAITPAPMGDLTPLACREEAGQDFILSGGVPPNLWLPEVPLAVFKQSVMDWLDLKRFGPRFIANAGDQVPPHAVEDRIEIMRDLVEQHGKY
ncbi:MAG: uroporphyrinogen decarboxylase family protein [Nitrososphaerales archaeon]